MTDTSRIRPADGVEFLPVGDEAILFDGIGQRLFHLNPVAARLWCRLGSMRLRPVRVGGDVLHMIGTWRRLGLLDGPAAAQRRSRAERPGGAPMPAAEPAFPAPATIWRRYRLLDTTFSLGHHDAELDAIVHPAIAHLETRSAVAEAYRLHVVEAASSFHVQHDGRVLASCAVRGSLAPLVLGALGLLATRRYPYLMALHAAGLGVAGGALLLAGRSGSGKSVLAAALVEAGWDYLSDDTVLLVPRSLEAVGVPYSLGIKRGGWRLVSRHCPSLETTGVYLRQDGKLTRYLLPPRQQIIARPRPVRWIGFPGRTNGEAGDIRPLGQLAGLRRLFEHCCAVPRPLTSDDVRCLIRWSSTVRFFELAVGDPGTAVARLQAAARQEDLNCDRGSLTLSENFQQRPIRFMR